MQIGAVSMNPYIYNTNAVSSKSLNRISAIGSDVTQSKMDVSALLSDDAKKQQNVNPLKPGQSLDFAGILQMQMQMSRLNEARVMQPAKEEEPEDMLKAMPAASADDNMVTASLVDDAMAAIGIK